MSETGSDPPTGESGESVPSRTVTGAERVGAALRAARGTMSQKAASVHFGVAYSTLCALEQGKDRNYGSHTLHQFDAMLGRDTWELYTQEEAPPPASRAQLDELRAEIEELRDRLEEVAAGPAPSVFAELTAAELDDVVSFAHFLLARRHRVNGS